MQLRELASNLADFCYPPTCAVCDEPTDERRSLFCGSCSVGMLRLELGAGCTSCAMPLAEPDAPCPWCAGRGVPHYEQVIRLGLYRDPLKRLIHRLKYHGRWDLAELLGDRLIAHGPAKRILAETDLIVPVPLHPLRHIYRGFNQSELIARRVARRCGIRICDALARLRNTETQTHLHSREKREENLRDAFALARPRAIAGLRVLVVDDVTTTGATLQSAARTLAPAKPASLSALVVAVADPKHKDFEVV